MLTRHASRACLSQETGRLVVPASVFLQAADSLSADSVRSLLLKEKERLGVLAGEQKEAVKELEYYARTHSVVDDGYNDVMRYGSGVKSQAERCRLVALPHRFRFSWEVFKGASAPRNLCRVCRSARMDCARESGSQEATDGGNVHQEKQATGVAANGKREITAKCVVRLLI